MTGRERILRTLNFEEPDYPPHFETMFELEYEAFGEHFPPFAAWAQYNTADKARAVEHCMDIYEKIVSRYRWDGLLVFWPWCDADGVRAARKRFGNELFIGAIVGGSVWSIEALSYRTFDDVDWTGFAVMTVEEPEKIHAIARRKSAEAIEKIKPVLDAGCDFVHIVNDVAFNGGPFLAPAQFHEFITPYLKEQVDFIKSRGAFAFVHSDGDINPVLDDYLSLGAHCFQSVDPMAGMDLATVKARCRNRMALMGNVQCSYLQDGPAECIRQSTLYALEHGTPGGGYIFGTSNTIFKGLPLEHYEYMLDVFHDFCNHLKRKQSQP